MDLSLNETQQLLKASAKEFVEKECPPTTVRELDDAPAGFSPDIWGKMVELGWTGILIPAEYGGLGQNLTDTAVVYEEMGKGLMPSPHHSTAVLCALILMEAGTDSNKARFLPGIARGEQIFALAATEEDYGWGGENVNLPATAAPGGFVLNGKKMFVQDAAVADQLIVVARTSKNLYPNEGLTLLVVDRKAPGVTVDVMEGFTGDKLAEVTFENVRVPAENVIGEVDHAWAPLQKALEKSTAVLCAYLVGGLQAVYDMTVNYGRTRTQFGQPIGNFQRVQDHIINIVNELDGARWTTYEALWKLDENKPGASASVAVAKVVASEGFHNGCNYSHEVHAGIGISREYPLYLFSKKARSYFHYLGSPDFHKKRLAGLLQI
ncbi:MAG: acyl-CoA/acyl-ACP dehydrogenase [Chloroflexi bacterium]|nr:acyl-CoA/acyl-ACP dehydrogenase [Chloroflexota bacterium]